MLKSHFNSNPPPRFILIEDTVETKGRHLLPHIFNNANSSHSQKFYCIFERDPSLNRAESKQFHLEDFTRDIDNFESFIKSLPADSIVIVNSLAHLLFKLGLRDVYQIFHNLLKSNNVKQLVTLLHVDLFLDDSVRKCFEHLSTLHVELLENHRVSYVFKKSARKIHRDIEMLRVESGDLLSEKLQTLQVSAVVSDAVNPENLSTFRIGLNSTEKQSRDNLVLPYLPKESGDILYTLDDVDDWDEEDPDDDLDI